MMCPEYTASAGGEFKTSTPTPSRQNTGPNGQGGHPPASPGLGYGDRDAGADSRPSGERNQSRTRSNGAASGQARICKKCGEPLTGQFVRALDGTFHLDCFRCRDCGQIVASKFFPADGEAGEQYPLCEIDYFRRLGLLCHQCGGALRGSYITALDRKYHVDHFTCSLCPTIFGAQDSYYEHEGQVYCHYHYSTQFAQRCSGCQTSILKQFVEIFRNGQNQHWHPECYMIHKFWNVRLNPPADGPVPVQDTPSGREQVRTEEERMEEKVYRIWSVLSTFEESSAACISDMLLHVSNGAYMDGVMVAKRFIWHVDLLFRSADGLDESMSRMEIKGLSYAREAKLLCKKIVSFFSLLSKTQDKGARKLGVTQELLTLVTGLAHYLKLLIRICLQGALRIEKEKASFEGLHRFLDDLGDLEALKTEDKSTATLQLTTGMSRLSASDSDHCALCRKPVEDECAKNGDKRWHMACTRCNRCKKELAQNLSEARLNPHDDRIFCGDCKSYAPEKAPPFERITKLQQYVFLLQVALARLLDILRNKKKQHTSEDAKLNGYDSGEGRATEDRSKLGGSLQAHHARESSYESTLNDVRRLRSTRLDKHLSSSFRKARTSRIMDGPESSSVRPGSSSGEAGGSRRGFSIVEERGSADEATNDTMFHNQDALTLDDIPRIVAAEQAREQRPYQPHRQELFRSPATEPSFGAGATSGAGHQRSLSDGRGPDRPTAARGGRRYFSELSGLEYFVVRHVAVMTMFPMVESEFTLDELLGLIESKKPPTFWKNLGKAFQKNEGKRNVKKKGVFGVPLEVVVEKDGAESTDGVGPGALRIPAIVDDVISVMRQMDLSVEGVFRKNGNIKRLNDLCEKIDKEGNVDLGSNNVVQVAALLKRYLRELPDPLMTHKLYRLWLTAAKIQDVEKKRHCLHLVCCLLPKVHRDSLEILFNFLKWAGSFHQVDDESGSRMDIKNLATVIAPNVLYNNARTLNLDSDPIFAIEAVETLIAHIEEMCMVPDDLVDALNDPALCGGNNGDITTKEILKRYGDRISNSAQRHGEVNEVVSQHHNPTRPPPRRIDADPSTWQNEASARPVQEPVVPYANAKPSTPPPRWRGAGANDSSPSPYNHDRGFVTNNSDVHPEGPDRGQPRREWRNSGWGRQNSGVATGTV